MTKQMKARIERHRGRPPRFETADDLMTEAFAYFADCDNNPMVVATNVKRKQSKKDTGDSREQGNDERTVARPYTLYGLCLWCNITDWRVFKQHCNSRSDADEFRTVIDMCENIVKNQQVSGAMVGVYAERLVSRLNGIGDSMEIKGNGNTMTWEEFRAAMQINKNGQDSDDIS